MAKNKNKNKYHKPSSEWNIQMFNAYGIIAKVINYYHIKLRREESDVVYDWYHTTGSLVRSHNKYFKSLGKYRNPEVIAVLIANED